MKRRLNGWQRLWVVLATTYLAALSALAYKDFPDADRVPHWTVTENLSAHVKSLFAPATFDDIIASKTVELPYGRALLLNKNVSAEDIRTAREEYNAFMGNALFAMRIDLFKQLGLFWLIPSLAVYALGYGIAWTRKGFLNTHN